MPKQCLCVLVPDAAGDELLALLLACLTASLANCWANLAKVDIVRSESP